MSFWAVNSDVSAVTSSKIAPVLNPNQREFLEDELRYREQMNILARNSSQNINDFYVRKEQLIDDPHLLDKHDSFYHTTKSLLVLFQIMGVMPIHRNPLKDNLPRTGYSWTSKQFIWAVIIYSLQTFLVCLVLRDRVLKFLNKRTHDLDDSIYNVIFISLLLTHFLLPIASWRHGHQVAIFKNMWTNYQYNYFKVTGSAINFPNLYRLTWWLCIFSWGLSIGINLSQYYLQQDFELWYTFAYYPIIAMLNCFCSLCGMTSPSKIMPVLNPNQRQFLEEEVRYQERMNIMAQNSESKDNNDDYFIRKEEAVDDPLLLDKYDAFYRTTKSLLMLFQIMGVMPLHRNPTDSNLPRTGFSWRSKQMIWALCVYSAQTFIVVLVLRERVVKFIHDTDKRFDEAIYNVIFISLLFTNFLLPVASWRHGQQVAIFKNMWTNYQYKYFKVTGTEIVFSNLYWLTWSLCIFSWALSIGINLSQYFLQPDFKLWYTFAYYHIIAMLNCFCSLWYINCNAFGTASVALSKSLQETLKGEKPAQKLTEYRHLWVDLSHMMQQLGRAYSNMYGMYCLVIFFTTIIATYGSFSEIIDHGATFKEIGLFVIVFYCMGLLYIICNEAHYASQKVGLDFQTKLLNVNLTSVDNATQKEVEMFLVAIAKNPPIMNLDGYANINRELITTNISFMATYLVVLLQFKITEQRGQRRKQAMDLLHK